MKILEISNKNEERVLRQKNTEFKFDEKGGASVSKKNFTKKELENLIREMRKTMHAANGIGLSANQIGLNYRLFVAEVPAADGTKKFYAVFNPLLEKPERAAASA